MESVRRARRVDIGNSSGPAIGQPRSYSFADPRRLPMTTPEPLRMFAAEFVSWAGGTFSGLIPTNVRITVDRRQSRESFGEVLKRVGLELRAGVTKVVLLSKVDQAACVYADDSLPRLFRAGHDLTMHDILPGFTVPVGKFFE